MAINLNVDPYYDDFDQAKGFHRILFKPGVAVQARELTQMQTIINEQVKHFGDNIYRDGAMIIPGSQVLDANYHSVKLQTTYNAIPAEQVIDDMVGQEVTGQTTGVTARVVGYANAVDADPPTIYVKYTSSGTDKETRTFADDEVISVAALEVKSALTAAAQKGTAWSVEAGVIYTKGNFVYFSNQTHVVSKYGTVTDKIIGFDVVESVVDSNDDSTLLDPANGSYNFTAPGADRYKIDLILTSRDFTPGVNDDPNFVELARIQNGKIISEKKASEYAVIADVLARRTYDESGDYVVKPYDGQLIEHLRTDDLMYDGFYPAASGGLESKMVMHVTPGKAYVKGYEIENVNTTRVDCEKARDFNSVTLSTVALPFGNYVVVDNVNNLPNLSTLPVVDLYNEYNSTAGAENGTKVGTARIRHIEHAEGTVGTAATKYRVYLFAITMIDGYSFTNDVKQLNITEASSDFTADIVPTSSLLSGAVSTTAASGALVGSGTRFNAQLKVNDYISIGANRYKITAITDDLNATISPVAAETISGSTFNILKSNIVDSDKNSFIFHMPVDVVKTVDPTGVSTTYSSRRGYDQTLSAGIVTLTSGSNEIFSSFSADNYQLTITSGIDAGKIINLDGKVTRGGAPTGKTVTFDISGDGYTTETVRITTTLQKTSSAADKKVKTLVSNSTKDVTAEADAQAPTISLGKADGYRLVSVKMGTDGAFGAGYVATTEIDITDRYEFDNGQKATYYGLASIRLKKGAEKPANPIRITFDYFTHGGGDYFSVDSYADIDYKDIPTVTLNNVEYELRDSLDFRPRISDDGLSFTGTGSSTTEMPDFENDLVTSYEYYLPRIDKIVLTSKGEFKYLKGRSDLDPVEPITPSDSLTLFIFKQKPYTFDIRKDVEVLVVDNRRYTMRDIGKLEDRIKNVEYYTSLSLLELDTKNYQIKDEAGFDRFKNGFVVDSFKGHGIGDVFNEDYGVAIDMDKFELRPISHSEVFELTEVAADEIARNALGYSLQGDLYMLDIVEEEAFIVNTKSSKTVNLNPFNIVSYNGKLTLDPPADIWYDNTKLPDIHTNVEGNYDSVVAGAKAKGTWGTVWGNWNLVRTSGYMQYYNRTGTVYSVREVIDKTVNENKVLDRQIIPKMRDVVINIKAEGMKPNSRLYMYFDETFIGDNCKPLVATLEQIDAGGGNFTFWSAEGPNGPIYTDASGAAEFQFKYFSEQYDMNTGKHTVYASDSTVMDPEDQETWAEAIFESMGYKQKVADEYVSTRNGRLESSTTTGSKSIDTSPPPPPPPPRPPAGYLDGVYRYAFGRPVEPGGYQFWSKELAKLGVTNTTIQTMTPGSPEAAKVAQVTRAIIYTGLTKTGEKSVEGNLYKSATGYDDLKVATDMAAAAVTATINSSLAATKYKPLADSARANGI